MNAPAERPGVPSVATIAGHPLHPMLVPFPMAFLTTTLATDLASRATQDPFWAQASFWLIAAGLLTGLAAALVGLVDFLGRQAIQRLGAAWMHLMGNAFALCLAAMNLYLRWPAASGPVPTSGMVLSGLVLLTLVGTGWLGGELVFRHRVGSV